MTTGRRSALLVATDRYEDDGFTELRAPAGDAAELAEVLADPGIGGFEVQPPLLNQPEGVVRREIDGFLDSARLGDTVLHYISGHGVLSHTGQLFFAMVDTLLGRLRSTAVPGAFVHEAMTHSRAHRKVLIRDSLTATEQPGNFEAAFTGFTGGGIDLVGPGVTLAGEDLLAPLRLLVERGRGAA